KWRVATARPFAMISLVGAGASEERRHRWRRNAKSSPSVEQQLQFISMGGDVPVGEYRARLCAMIVPDWGPGPEEHRHRWRRNAKSSPSVEQQLQFIPMGGDVPVDEHRSRLSEIGRASWRERPEEYRHRGRRNAKKAPCVEQELHLIPMGEDVSVDEHRARLCAMIVPDWGPGPEEHRHRWRRNAKSSPSVEQQLQFIPMGGDVPVDEHRSRLS